MSIQEAIETFDSAQEAAAVAASTLEDSEGSINPGPNQEFRRIFIGSPLQPICLSEIMAQHTNKLYFTSFLKKANTALVTIANAHLNLTEDHKVSANNLNYILQSVRN